MTQHEEAEIAFEKIINHAPSSVLRKAAKAYWTAHTSDAGASDKEGAQLETAIKSISIDYRRPALECLEAFEACKENSENLADCYNALAICLAERVVHVV